MSEDYKADICVDCLMWQANADDSGMDEETAARVRAAVGLAENETVALGDCETFFSWSPCEVCGSTLGGDRETVWVLVH